MTSSLGTVGSLGTPLWPAVDDLCHTMELPPSCTLEEGGAQGLIACDGGVMGSALFPAASEPNCGSLRESNPNLSLIVTHRKGEFLPGSASPTECQSALGGGV